MDLKQERSCNNSNKRQDKEDRPSPVVSFMDGIARPTQDRTGQAATIKTSQIPVTKAERHQLRHKKC